MLSVMSAMPTQPIPVEIPFGPAVVIALAVVLGLGLAAPLARRVASFAHSGALRVAHSH